MADPNGAPDPEVRLFRAVKFDQFKNDADGNERASSGAFQNLHGSKMSVYREDVLLDALGSEVEALAVLAALFDEDDYGIVELTVAEYRTEEQTIEPDPRSKDDEGPAGPAHAHVVGEKGSTRRRRWAKAARIVRPPRRNR